MCEGAIRNRNVDEPGRVRDVVRAIIAADNARDLDAALGCYADDAVWIPPSMSRAIFHTPLEAKIESERRGVEQSARAAADSGDLDEAARQLTDFMQRTVDEALTQASGLCSRISS